MKVVVLLTASEFISEWEKEAEAENEDPLTDYEKFINTKLRENFDDSYEKEHNDWCFEWEMIAEKYKEHDFNKKNSNS